jgi:chromosome segregation ATPase
MEENKLIYTNDEVWAMYYKDPIYATLSYSQFARKNDWVMVKGTQIQSLQQQNAEQAARIEKLEKTNQATIEGSVYVVAASRKEYAAHKEYVAASLARISELEKQLKEAQEKG